LPVAQTAAQIPDLSKEALVWDKMGTRIREEADGTGTRETTARVRILADAGVKQMAVLTFTYTAMNQQVEIEYVRVIKPDGSVVVTPDYNVQDLPADVTRSAPMYSDIHQKHVAVKGLGVGDTLEYQTTLRTLKPEVPGHFWLEYSFEKDQIMLDEQLDLDLPADRAVTVASSDLQPILTSLKDRKLYHWASSNLARPDPDAPAVSEKHWKPSVQVTTFTSWEQVGAWYASLQHDSLAITPAIQAKADALTKGLTTKDEKLHAIFNDVALHIHYVGLEFGIGRYQPHPADDVLSNEYGDCKDKHTLLAALLKAAGIEAWPVLISSSRELDAATPSPAQFNHVITLVLLDGKLLWMDSTEEVAPVGVLMAQLRDKQALAIPLDKPAYLEHSPVGLPFAQSNLLQATGILTDQGQFTGHITQTTYGDVELIIRGAFRMVPQSQWKEFVQRISGSMGFGGEVSNPQVSAVEQLGQPFVFSYDYSREKYNQWSDKETTHWISPPLPGMGIELPPGIKEKKPADEVFLGALGETTFHAEMQLPKGWSMVEPPHVDLKEDWLEYHSSYSFKDGVFTANRSLRIKKSNLALDDWERYLTFRRAMYDDLNHQTLISPPGIEVSQRTIDQFAAFTPEQKARIEEGKEVLQPARDAATILAGKDPLSADDLVKATDLAKKGVEGIESYSLTMPEDDPKSLSWSQSIQFAWTVRGWTALEAKDMPTAESYLQVVWKLGHDQMSGYLLGRVLEAKGDITAAAHQYELAWITSGIPVYNFRYFGSSARDKIADSYQKLTGKSITTTALNHGVFNDDLLAELDKDKTFNKFAPTGKSAGDAYFIMVYEADAPIKAYLIQGDKKFTSLGTALEALKPGGTLPTGSKARMLREVHVSCSESGYGCDAYLMQPFNLHIPGLYDSMKAMVVTQKNQKSKKIKDLPVQAPTQ